jgi:hypothetical protein
MSFHQILLYLDAATITVIVVLMGRFAWIARTTPNAWLVVMLGLVGIAYVLSCRQDYAPLLPPAYAFDFGSFHAVLNVARNAGCGVFALLCHRIFRPGRAFPTWLIGMMAVQLLLEEPVEWLVGPQWEVSAPRQATLVYEVLPALLQMGFMIVSLYWMLAERESDLVEPRRRMRTALLLVYAVQGVASLGLERIAIGLDLVPYAWMYPMHSLFVAMSMCVASPVPPVATCARIRRSTR